MRKIFNLLLVLCFSIGNAQTLINVHPVSGFQVSSNDILSFDVITSAIGAKEAGVNVIFRIEVSKDGHGKVLGMVSGRHTIKNGVNNFNISNINIVSRRYATPEMANYESKMRSFPEGSYTYCVNIICQDEVQNCMDYTIQENQQTQCHEFTVLPISPLLLSLPEDEDVLKEKRPNFTWIPPMPLGSDPAISYEMTLVHLNEDQSPEDGIRRNRPIFQRDGIKSVNQTFPTTLEDLVPGEHYGWQVKAHLGRMVAATSDVWEFEIEKEEVVGSFNKLTASITPQFIYVSKELRFVVNRRYAMENNLQYQITNSNRKEILENRVLPYFAGKEGVSPFILDLEELDLTNGHYTLIVSNKNGEKKYLRFKYEAN